MNAGKHVVDIAVEQRQAVFDRRRDRRVDVVGIERARKHAEARRQRQSLDPGHELLLLQVNVRLGKLIDGSHVIVVRVRQDDVVHPLGLDAQFLEHPHRRDPFWNREFPRHLGAAAFVHEAGVDQHVEVAALGKDESERQIHHSFVTSSHQQARDRLIVASRILNREQAPALACFAAGF